MGKKIVRMAGKVAGPRGSWRRRWSVFLSFVLSVGLALVVKQNVFAVHELGFELDGNTVPGNAPAPFTGKDWNQIFTSAGQPVPLPDVNLPGFEHAAFVRDFTAQTVKGSLQFVNADTTTYATGSKDTLPISTGQQTWQCAQSNNVTDKDDILNAYAATYTDPSTGDEILYFGMERNANTGDANFGFWFLQDAVGCTSPGGATTFVGKHQTGDLFIVSAFSNGGTVSTIIVYRWEGDNDTGGLNPTPVASGVDCRAGTTLPGDDACGAANTAGITLQWQTAEKTDGVGTTLRTAEFFEGALNLSDAQLGGKCFNTFVGNTRSSTSLTATIFDWAGGSLGACVTTVTTTPSLPTNEVGTPIPANARLDVTDTAVIDVTGADTFSGTVSFFLCGPLAGPTLCATGGVAAGSTTLTNVTSPAKATSNTLTVTSAGWYCWRGKFTATGPVGVLDGEDSSRGECFLVTPLTPTLATQAGAGPVAFGQPVTDVATLTGTANLPGSGGPTGSTDGSIGPGWTSPPSVATGTITFTLVKDVDPTPPSVSRCGAQATGTGTNPQDFNGVLGDGKYGPVQFTPNAPGVYHWIASYNPDVPTNNPNTQPDSHNLDCLDSNERVEIQQIPTTISTAPWTYPNDTAVIGVATGDVPAGSVTFKLFGQTAGKSALQNCESNDASGVRYSQTVAVAGGAQPQTVKTTNAAGAPGAYEINSVNFGNHYWRVEFTPTPQTHTGRQSACVERMDVPVVADSSGTGDVFPPAKVFP